MTTGIKLFEGTSGKLLVPDNPAATDQYLKWDPTTQTWISAVGGGGGGDVSSVFGRTGAVTAQSGDYTSSQITGTSNLPGATVKAELDYLAQPPQDVAGGAAPALDFATNRYQRLTLSANASPTMTVPPAGVEVFLEVIQPAAGGPFSVTAWPAIVDWSVIGVGGGPPALGTAANAVDLLRFISNGTRLRGAFHGEY